MTKFIKSQREYLRQLVIECELQRFSTEESLNYIKSKLKLKQGISSEYYFTMKRRIKKETGSRLNELMVSKDAYMLQHFERIDEIKQYQRELWGIFRKYPNRPEVQKNCLSELHELTVSLSRLYDLIPDLMALRIPSAPVHSYYSSSHPSYFDNRDKEEGEEDPEAKF